MADEPNSAAPAATVGEVGNDTDTENVCVLVAELLKAIDPEILGSASSRLLKYLT
jgi:hypothetical protein